MSLTDELAPADPVAAGCHVTVLTDRCAGCQECIVRCPTEALTLEVDRWIAVADDTRCIGCRQCVRTCPFTAIEVSGPVLVASRIDPPTEPRPALRTDASEVRMGFTDWAQALAEAERCLQCPDPTCVRGCPAHNDIPGFIGALRTGDLAGAAELLSLTSCLPDVCSRVCDWATQCEGACSLALAGAQPVAIGHLERFVAEHADIRAPEFIAPDDENPLSVAVVGSGPAGIGAAWELVSAGARVTVYERSQTPGGLLSWGIPDFTLPDDIATRPWRQLTAVGVELRCGVDVKPDDVDHLRAEHDAVILANGASKPLQISVPGTELAGVVDATTFLQAAKAALEPGGSPAAFRTRFGLTAMGRLPAVLVLGAGNTAMDVARCALRLECAPTCIDWLDERYALTRPDELAEARHEGVRVRFARTLVRLEGEAGRVARASLAVTTQPRPDRPPAVQPGAPEPVPVDLVVMAMGYRNDGMFATAVPGTPVRRQATGLPDRRWTASGILNSVRDTRGRQVGSLALDREVGLHAADEPFADRVWVAGDALVGPSTVVEAMGQGRRAAAAVLAAAPRRPKRAWTRDTQAVNTNRSDSHVDAASKPPSGSSGA